ncbi:MAG: D-alanine--D-alanine ligase [Lachnospiraceae bacterium]|jgi:D-alanine-D-alanine ligase|nr:D-alanine--D-alanine ligase [Lachnospiraceae bacterium]
MKIAVLAGGTSTERDVSLVTGREVYKALRENGHKAILLDAYLGCDMGPDEVFDADIDWALQVAPISEAAPDIEEVKVLRGRNNKEYFGPNVIKICQAADIVFMALHGDCGENGKVQAAFDLMGVKYTGTDSFSSSLAMDKAISKQMFKMYGVQTPDNYMLKGADDDYRPQFPCVVKICNGGSSVGVYIANNESEYKSAVKDAFKYESRVMVEEYIKGREFTCCVIEGKALPIVEIEPKTGFYDYKNKYQAGSTIETCPANIDEATTARIQEEAVKAYNALGIKTYARMDFLMNDKNEIFCLEANTLPGMTPTSLIPQEAAAAGVSYNDLCEWIIRVSLQKWA